MREFKLESLPKELQDLVLELSVFTELCKVVEEDNQWGGRADYYQFKVVTAADPEFGNSHVPLAVYLVKQGAKKGEVVKITGA
jgi:hypothetical protein